MILTKELITNLKIKPEGICYIGANEGQELPDMIKFFPNSTIHCFEPQKKPFNLLMSNFGDMKNLYFYNFALGNKDKKVFLHTNNNNNNMSSSILEPKEHLFYHKKVTFSGQEEIELKQYSNLGIHNVNFLNIDVQGYELEVLKGFGKLDEIKYIATEVNRKEMYKDCVQVNDLDKYLKKHNFIRVKTIWWKSVIPWGDAFYIKKDLITKKKLLISILKNKVQNIKGYFWFISLLIKFNLINKDKHI